MNKRYKKYSLILIPLLGFITALCSSTYLQTPKDSWERNKQKWVSNKTTNYRYTLSVDCFCGEAGLSPVLIEVRNGIKKSVTTLSTSELVDSYFFTRYETVSDLFDLIERNLNKTHDTFNCEYDSNLGFPKKIEIDHHRNTADDEFLLEVTNFEIIK